MTPKQKNGWKKAGRIIGTLLLVFVLTASIFAGIFMAYINSAMRGKVEVYLDEFETQVSTELYYQDPDTQEWVMYQTLYMDENRIWVDLENIPKYLQDAAVAIEDKRFEKHHGVDWKGTTRAILYTLFGKNVQGGSTITQQLVKNVTGDNQVTVKRKITEIYRALELEKRYEKDEILEAYLNEVYFGQRCSGVMTAARVYFGKDVSELTLAECASMMGITNNPSMYDPFISSWTRENNRERQLTILSEMLSQGKIDQEEYDTAVAEDIQFANGFTISGKYVGSDGTVTEPDTEDTTDTSDDTASPADDSTPTIKGSNSWFTDALYNELLTQLQEDLNYTKDEAKELIFSGGLRIYSTVDPKVQEGVEKTMYNEDDLIPALWHEEPVCLRDYPADSSSWDEVQYDEATGLPITKDGYAVYGQEAIPVYADEEGTTLKTGKSTDPDYPNDTTVYLCVYEKVRTQASIAVLDYDGNILGIGGGIGEKKVDLGFNRATSPHQTGSTMKPIGAYALALDYKLINYSSQILDSPYYSAEDKKVLKDQYIGVMSPYSEAAQSRTDVWRAWPTNYGGVGGQGNPMLIYDALQQSYNTVAVWVGDMVGVDYLYNFVHDTLECSYISAENDMDLGPLVLGSQSNGLTVVQLAGAYTMFNTGSYTTPHYYTEVTDYQGNMILDNNKYINTTQAISADTAYIMNRMLWNVLHSPKGTAYGRAPDGEMDSVAKTGTTSNYKDYTFAGLTPYYVTAIWWGCDRPTEMDKLGKAGGSGKPIQLAWKYLMEDLQADLPVKEFAKGENVVEKRFDTSTGAIVSGGGAVGYYTEDNLPDSSYTVTSEEDPFAALAQAAAEAAAGAE